MTTFNYDYEFVDGYDTYGPVGTDVSSLILTEYTSITATGATLTGMAMVAALTGTGQALAMSSGAVSSGSPRHVKLQKTVPANYARSIAGHTFKADLSVNNGWTLLDSGVDQCTVQVNAVTGLVSIIRGINSIGVTLVTSTASVTDNSVHYLCWDIGIHNTAGYAKVWLDNVLIIDTTAAGINTRATANNSFNGISLFTCDGTNTCDHSFWWCYLATGAADVPPLTSPIVESQAPTGDSSVAWTVVAGIVGYPSRVVATTSAPGAGKLALRKFTPGVNATINSVAFVPGATSATAKFKPVVYSDSGGIPNTLLTTGAEVVGTTSGTILTLPVTTPQALTAGTQYWIGYITDTSVVIQVADALTLGYSANNTYASGAPGTAPAMTASQASYMIWGNCTGITLHYSTIDENPPLGSLSYNASATVNQQDLLTFPNLSTNPLEIYSVGLKAYLQRSDAGARTMDLQTKSGATTTAGTLPGISPSTSWGFWTSYWHTDPNTGVAWTPSGVNAALYGYKIAT